MENTMELVDRYIAEVGRGLPRKSRLDIEAEILTALEDMLRERSQASGRTVDEDMVVEVLKEYGPPQKVAASYQPERSLVGPRLFPSFLSVARVILPVVAAIALVQVGISLGQAPRTFEAAFEVIFLGVAGFIGSAFTALGALLVLFVVVERFLPGFSEKSGEWDPRRLPSATRHDRVDVAALLLGVFFCAAGIVIFNFFPQAVNLGYHANGSWWVGFLASDTTSVWSRTILSDAFFRYLPALTLLWSLSILLDVALLVRSRWETWSRWASFLLRVMTIALAIFMISGPALLAVDAQVLAAAGFPDPLTIGLVLNLAGQGIIAMLALVILSSLITALRLLVRLTGRNLTPRLEKFAHP